MSYLTTSDGSILVFLPGLAEITGLDKLLKRPGSFLGLDLTDSSRYRTYMLHSAIPKMQLEVFDKLPSGIRKIILSRTLQKRRVTIPDVTHVIDSGKHREKQYYQEKRMTSLICGWISKSNCKQRSGRAGRVQNGTYWGMMSKKPF